MNQIPTGALWTPSGMVNVHEVQAARAVEEYDASLKLGYRNDTHEWIVFVEHGTKYNDGQPFPVFTFGETLPSADKIKEKLYKVDVRRHGDKILKEIIRRNDDRQKVLRDASSEASAIVAETMLSAFQGQGHNPFPQSTRNLHRKGGGLNDRKSGG